MGGKNETDIEEITYCGADGFAIGIAVGFRLQ